LLPADDLLLLFLDLPCPLFFLPLHLFIEFLLLRLPICLLLEQLDLVFVLLLHLLPHFLLFFPHLFHLGLGLLLHLFGLLFLSLLA